MTRFLVLALALAAPAAAQSDALQSIAALSGDWSGEGWVAASAGERLTVDARESVRLALDETAFILEGQGDQASMIRVLTFDEDAQTYSMYAYGSGAPILAEATVADDQIQWTYTDALDRMARWTERVTADGQWIRTHEVSPDGGSRWIPVAEFTLQRSDA